MTPEYWQRVDELFQAAIELPPEQRSSFIGQECAGDENLRSEVEALIASDEHGLSFIEDPALEMAADLLVHHKPELAEGHQLGSYKILSLLGAGGMGEVYLAEDTELGRKIAIKLLPAEFTRDKERLRRFRQEARAASALNHPNILTIHQIIQAEDRYFIATEFIDGETLRQRLRRSKLPTGEVIEIAAQIGGALVAAHQAGIVHRDIKPENIMLRRDGYVKVLDFGLAKLTEQQELTGHAQASEDVNISSGLVMGTVKYMSPEQAQGLQVDPRSDIFSFGVVLYEMIAGRPPFEGKTANELITAILKKEPAPLTDVPGEIQRIINKALRKKKEQRYQTIHDLLTDLKSLKDDKLVSGFGQLAPMTGGGSELSTGAIPTLSTASTVKYVVTGINRHKTGAALILASLVMVGLSATLGLKRFLNPPRKLSGQMNIVRVPNTGKSVAVAISPDGKYLAHAVTSAGKQSLWFLEVATKSAVEIVPAADAEYNGLTFSKDGNSIFYVNYNTLYQVPARGGEAKEILVGVDGAISFSPDGGRFAFVRSVNPEESALVISNLDGSGEQTLATRKKPAFLSGGPAWSPDGTLIACGFGMTASDREAGVLGIEVATRREELLTSQKWQVIDRLMWLPDGTGLIAPAGESGTAPTQIWNIPIRGGEARTITTDLNNYGDLGLTANAESLVTIQYARRSHLWIVPSGSPNQARPITSGEHELYRAVTFTRDGRLLYASNAGDTRDIWIMDSDGTDPRQLTANAGKNLQPEASTDGRYIVFSSNRAQKNAFNIWRMNIDGGNPIQLTYGNGEVQPVCSPDGRWVIYSKGGPETGPEKKTVWKVPIDGGEPVQLAETPSGGAAISPDGSLIACWYKAAPAAPWQIALIPLEGGPPTKVLDAERTSIFRLRWTPDGQAISYIYTRDGVSNIWSQPISGGPPKQVTQFTSEQIEGFDWSLDGNLVCSRNYTARDVVLISDFR